MRFVLRSEGHRDIERQSQYQEAISISKGDADIKRQST